MLTATEEARERARNSPAYHRLCLVVHEHEGRGLDPLPLLRDALLFLDAQRTAAVNAYVEHTLRCINPLVIERDRP